MHILEHYVSFFHEAEKIASFYIYVYIYIKVPVVRHLDVLLPRASVESVKQSPGVRKAGSGSPGFVSGAIKLHHISHTKQYMYIEAERAQGL